MKNSKRSPAATKEIAKTVKAIIGGSSLVDSRIFDGWEELPVETPYGKTLIKKAPHFIFLQRHGEMHVPPHRINHHANIWALKKLGTDEVIAFNSTGSLKVALKPGDLVIPDDFISKCTIPTFFDDSARYTIPTMDAPLAEKLYMVCKNLEFMCTHGGVYIQTQGPRFETKAEINVFKNEGDLVGMTMASEATLCIEQSIPYVSICSIDNYCNGIIREALDMEEVLEKIRLNARAFEIIVRAIVSEGL
jgi:5'-methylthioadenosine phosphorylase